MPKSAEEILREMLDVAGIPAKPSYNPAEVCCILGIGYNTFRRMCQEFELIDGRPKSGALDAFKARGERRVSFPELVRYLKDNNAYTMDMDTTVPTTKKDRDNNKLDSDIPLPGQLKLF